MVIGQICISMVCWRRIGDNKQRKDLPFRAKSATIKKTNRLEMKGCALLLADTKGIRPKAAEPSLSFAVPKMQEVRILSAWIAVLCP